VAQPNTEKVAEQQVVVQPQMNLKNNEGVVALKSLTNGLVAAIFSNGALRVVRASDGCVVVEMKLITDGKFLDA